MNHFLKSKPSHPVEIIDHVVMVHREIPTITWGKDGLRVVARSHRGQQRSFEIGLAAVWYQPIPYRRQVSHSNRIAALGNGDQPITSAAISGKGQSPTGILRNMGSRFLPRWSDAGFQSSWERYGGIPSETEYSPAKDPNVGFYDPDGVYPLDDYLGEQDTNRLARGELLTTPL
jgi:hypothetical protein